MDDILFKIIYLALTILAAIVVRYVVPYLDTKIDDTKLLELKSFVRKAIAWAEVAIDGKGMGPDKFDLVLEKVLTWINEKGVKLTEEQARILIQGIFAEVDGYTVNRYGIEEDINFEDEIEEAIEDVIEEATEAIVEEVIK